MRNLTRREFAAVAGSVAMAPFTLSPEPVNAATITAQDVIDRIKKNIGVEWKPESPDGVKAGDPSTTVTGIATTSMATVNVLRSAIKAGANVVITAQPTFYSRTDAATSQRTDRVLDAKNELIAKNGVVIVRLSEHWRLRQPDPRTQGMAAALGWTTYRSAGDHQLFHVPSLTLGDLADHVKKRLQSRGGIRVVGDPKTRVQRIGLLPGTTPIQASLQMLPNVDVIVAGEVREWESVEYARDTAFSGERKGLILLGRVVSEEPGMNICADWLKMFVAEVPVTHVSAGDPYWRPVS
jgi:putative NIF3 family GTP cyclohydrolase 1 type 2